ncbi:carbohydrate-binding domain-containing protein [Paraclostridium sordellii]|uniref:carbohydrate-binding domain-containing protein n=1 Tax=Paraclostridium sordellii TaxID=1505 RepID=UPI0005DDA70A|nr:carbohydrate-binding domain-containing protein [Paeniclostridium sordellii]CEO08626.1 Dockerin type 1 [[Clostridium] sordellii] [Paeniclostridium sordellii]CEP87288.1 Dockerin type 1 [[Clostridium] sordellii] [Paeniclostridium sordellii]CEP99031.1 Dockerin type 1 [[Clostridium] sordellii] [Paeniclostridium sordellii]
MNKKLLTTLCALSLTVSVMGCSAKTNTTISTNKNTTTVTNQTIDSTKSEELKEVDTYIEFGDSINIKGEGAKIENNVVTITSAGTYSIKGELKDGQIVVSAGEEDKVQIQLNNANITSSNSAPIYVKSAKRVIIGLIEGTKNTITDGKNYVFKDATTDEPNSAIFSKDDLTIIGTGSLVVNANYNNGITSKDDLKIEDGQITVNAVSDGLRGKDSITILDGKITIDAKEDGMKSSNTKEAEKGYIHIQGGTLNITAGQDGIQAETNAVISNGEINIVSGEGSKNSSKNENWGNFGDKQPSEMKSPGMQPPDKNNTTTIEETDSTSAKGIKATSNITISGGNINIDSSDDSIHSNDNIVINGGKIKASSGDDGVHADTKIEINGGYIDITKSYEGIESQSITINYGNINVVASDDGINAGGGNDNSSTSGRPGENNFNSSSKCEIAINGGYIVVDARGDGIDANGSITITDGTTIVNGPENNGNGALDYDGSCNISGGILIAAGSQGMAQSPSLTSSQNSVNVALSSQQANTIIHIEDEKGNEVITFAPSKQYQSVVVSSPELKKGSTYTVSYGGISTGKAKDGLYTGGKYSGGEKSTSFTVSESVTNLGSAGGVSMGDPSGGKGGIKPAGNGSMQPPPQNSMENNIQTQ